MGTGKFINKTRDKKVCPGSQMQRKQFKVRSKNCRIKFFTGSSDG